MTVRDNAVTTAWKEFGSLINTGLILSAALGYVVTFGRQQEGMLRDIDANKTAIEAVKIDIEKRWSAHDLLHRDRGNEAVAERARLDERIKALEKPVSELALRMANSEAAVRDFVATSNKTDEKINQLVTDVAIIKDQLVGRTQPESRSRLTR